MNTNLENLFAYIETLGWDVYCDGAGSVELYQFSPAGEDFGFYRFSKQSDRGRQGLR